MLNTPRTATVFDELDSILGEIQSIVTKDNEPTINAISSTLKLPLSSSLEQLKKSPRERPVKSVSETNLKSFSNQQIPQSKTQLTSSASKVDTSLAISKGHNHKLSKTSSGENLEKSSGSLSPSTSTPNGAVASSSNGIQRDLVEQHLRNQQMRAAHKSTPSSSATASNNATLRYLPRNSYMLLLLYKRLEEVSQEGRLRKMELQRLQQLKAEAAGKEDFESALNYKKQIQQLEEEEPNLSEIIKRRTALIKKGILIENQILDAKEAVANYNSKSWLEEQHKKKLEEWNNLKTECAIKEDYEGALYYKKLIQKEEESFKQKIENIAGF
jgi:hypothetical protein